MFKENSYYEKLAVLDTLTRLLQTGHFLQLPKGCEAAEQRQEASPRSGQKIVKGQRLQGLSQLWFLPKIIPIIRLAFTHWPAWIIHSFIHLFICFLFPPSVRTPSLLPFSPIAFTNSFLLPFSDGGRQDQMPRCALDLVGQAHHFLYMVPNLSCDL